MTFFEKTFESVQFCAPLFMCHKVKGEKRRFGPNFLLNNEELCWRRRRLSNNCWSLCALKLCFLHGFLLIVSMVLNKWQIIRAASSSVLFADGSGPQAKRQLCNALKSRLDSHAKPPVEHMKIPDETLFYVSFVVDFPQLPNCCIVH